VETEYEDLGGTTPFDADARCVSVGLIPNTQNDIWFPADKLTIIANQPFHGKMNGDMTAQMLSLAAKPPDFNQTRIMDHARNLLGISTVKGQSGKFYSVGNLSNIARRVVS